MAIISALTGLYLSKALGLGCRSRMDSPPKNGQSNGNRERWSAWAIEQSAFRLGDSEEIARWFAIPSIFFSPGLGRTPCHCLKATSLSTRLSADYKRVGKASLNGLELCARHL
jgi:hypothetical protein